MNTPPQAPLISDPDVLPHSSRVPRRSGHYVAPDEIGSPVSSIRRFPVTDEQVQRLQDHPSTRARFIRLVGTGVVIGILMIITASWAVGVWNTYWSQWHEGDAHITHLTANVGHQGTSEFLATYRSGTIIVIEFSHNGDALHSHVYTFSVMHQDQTQRTITLSVDSQKNLIIRIDTSPVGYVLENTGDQFQNPTQP